MADSPSPGDDDREEAAEGSDGASPEQSASDADRETSHEDAEPTGTADSDSRDTAETPDSKSAEAESSQESDSDSVESEESSHSRRENTDDEGDEDSTDGQDTDSSGDLHDTDPEHVADGKFATKGWGFDSEDDYTAEIPPQSTESSDDSSEDAPDELTATEDDSSVEAVDDSTEAPDDPSEEATEVPTEIEDDGGFFGSGSGPVADREMPLTEHIEEMLKRLAVVIAVAGIVSMITFPFAEQIINFLWDSILPAEAAGDISRPRLYGVLELWFTKVKVASLAGLIVALPVLVYESYRFMRPGLYPHERRYYLAAVPTSLVLAIVGVAFAYFLVLPGLFSYFLYYSEGVAEIGFALGRTFNLILIMMAYLAIVFQIPLFILLAMMMGLVTRQWLADRRLIFWGAFLGISFIFSPDPTGMVPILVALTMVGLFEGTLLLTKWTQQRRGGGETGVGA